MTNILHQVAATSAQINQADYLYNDVGIRMQLTDRRGGQAFVYDDLDRLTSASHPLLATPQVFGYDEVGNRTTSGSVVNAGNQLTADATFSYQYDDNGNLTRKTFLATGNFILYTYSVENLLTKVEEFVAGNPIPIATSTYKYDGFGRRIEKTGNGQTKRYIYDGRAILLEYDGNNVLQARYIHGPGLDDPVAVSKAGNSFFYHQDGLGTVTDLTDNNGAIAKSYAYDSHGNIVNQSGSLEQPFTYTGRELDLETGLYYYRARYYDSNSGRFLTKDPQFTFRGGDLNLYRYANNNPITRKDPLGLFSTSGCCEEEDDIRKEVQEACDLVERRIYDPALMACILRRCEVGGIDCRDGEDECPPKRFGKINKFLGQRTTTLTLCTKNLPPRKYGEVAVHEWAHSCGWEHEDYFLGVPGEGSGLSLDVDPLWDPPSRND